MAKLHWRPALLAGSLLAGPAAWLGQLPWQSDMAALERVREEVAHLEGSLEQIGVSAATTQTRPVVADRASRPHETDGQMVWSWLLQRLQAHGLQVQALRPSPVERAAGLPEQVLVLEVLGRWVDWLAFEQALDRHAPWWTVTQWQVTPGAMPGQVRVRWQARWAWRADAPADGAPVALPVWSVSGAMQPAADVFLAPGQASASTAVINRTASQAPGSASTAEPSWRLLGVWQQQGVSYAILGHGLEQVVLTPGQLTPRDGHRLVRLGPGEALLQPPDPAALPLRLVLQGDSR